MIEIKRCRSCNARIRWVETQAGKKMPLDAEPRPEGNIVFTPEEAEDGRVRVLTGDEQVAPATRPRYVSHFATCPDAKKNRKGAARDAFDRTRDRVMDGLDDPDPQEV